MNQIWYNMQRPALACKEPNTAGMNYLNYLNESNQVYYAVPRTDLQ